MKTILMSLAALSMVLASASCVGAGKIKTEKRPMTDFNIEKKVRVIHGGNLGRNPTGKEILDAWGRPDEQQKAGDDTIWTYHTGTRMKGVILFAYLPLPLGYPRGKNGIDFYFKENATSPWRAVERTSGFSGGYVDMVGSDRKVHRLGD